MRPTALLMLLALVPLTLWAATESYSPQTSGAPAVYDESPSHVWNRLYAALRVRENPQGKRLGEDSLDPMLWRESQQLLSHPSHEFALRVLDEFLRSHAESLIQNPIKRAMLQHDLWAVFDWSVEQYSGTCAANYDREKRELQSRLAQVLQRLALTREQIQSLPDNYALAVDSGAFGTKYDATRPQQPFLPPDLFDPHGPWVCITPSPESIGDGGVAKLHVANFSGRSVFLVFVRLPDGRRATMDYFQALWSFPQPWVPGPIDRGPLEANPELPSFSAGTQVALVRQMILFDTQGNLVVSPIKESVQIRVYREITTARQHDFSVGPAAMTRNSGQDFFEIRTSRPLLFSGRQGGLRATDGDETEPPTFQTIGSDMIRESEGQEGVVSAVTPIMQRCLSCHSGGGIRSFNSLESLLKPSRRQHESQDVEYGPRYWSESNAVWWKEKRYDWGLLNGYWRARIK